MRHIRGLRPSVSCFSPGLGAFGLSARIVRMVVVLCTLSVVLYHLYSVICTLHYHSFFITSAGCVLLTCQILWLMVRRVMPATMSIASTR